MTDTIDFQEFSEEMILERNERTKDRLNNVLIGLVAVLLTALITGLGTWLSFGPNAQLSAFEKTFVTREILQDKVGELQKEIDKTSWSRDKPYITSDVASIKTDIKELQNAVKTIIRMEDKIDVILNDMKELKISEKETSNRVLKLETKGRTSGQ